MFKHENTPFSDLEISKLPRKACCLAMIYQTAVFPGVSGSLVDHNH
ncbi:hypothetical protein HMPREF9997_00528 [Corynebacterium durum F0235]|jgi:hypothetical protein|uniref:Uncharacterized protein n=1 Tax=Corynebacterium durum F0235 TaxID=1035195 RepID=L1MKC8_9CORY|nr:hypothetical protein HMPREF9997_00528 [Corynebacterium durum F0235]